MVKRRDPSVPGTRPSGRPEADRQPGVSFLPGTYTVVTTVREIRDLFADLSPLSESAAIEAGLSAATWRTLQEIGFSRDEISLVVGNSPKTIRRKENRDEPLDVPEGDRTMRFLRLLVEAADAFGDAAKALKWMRRSNIALSGKTPLDMIATEAGTALVRRALGVIAYGGVA